MTGLLRRAAIVLAYALLFWGVLPAALVYLGAQLDELCGWSRSPAVVGWIVVVAGLVFAAWAMWELWARAQGVAVSALPPPKLVTTGAYALCRHPIYVGYSAAVFGLGLGVGSPGLAFVVAPAFVPCWCLYALAEERGLSRRFGDAFERYREQVGLIPGVAPRRPRRSSSREGGA
jgi:protein-S-isoprenylcysteine O-methyltransferase Ste14